MDNATITMDILYLVYNKSSIHAKKNITRLCKETSYYFDRILHNDCMKAVVQELTPEKFKLFYYGNQRRRHIIRRHEPYLSCHDFDIKYDISAIIDDKYGYNGDGEYIISKYNSTKYYNLKNADIKMYRRILILRLNDCIKCMKKFNETNNFFEHCKKYEF